MKEIKETIYNSVKRIQEAPPDHLIGLSTGFARLDEVLGGLVEGTLVTIGGRTGMGVCQNDASSFFTNKAPTFTSQGFVMSKRFCTFRH